MFSTCFQIRCEDLVKLVIERTRELSPILNAVVVDRFEEAMQEARDIDKLLASSAELPPNLSEENAPFLGVPFTAKEAFAVKGLPHSVWQLVFLANGQLCCTNNFFAFLCHSGMPNTSGLMLRKHVLAETNAPVVTRMRASGAILIGLTNCSELCMWYESNNLLYGRTRNAYHRGRTVGGSSGEDLGPVSGMRPS